MRILLAIDNSQFSEAAAQAVIDRAKPGETEIRVLHVVDILTDLFPELTEYYRETGRQDDPRLKPAETLVNLTAERFRAKGLTATGVVEWGDPKAKIIEYASRWGADLIILGSHGRRSFKHFLLGSVSEIVARHAKCSVEIVRIRDQQDSIAHPPSSP